MEIERENLVLEMKVLYASSGPPPIGKKRGGNLEWRTINAFMYNIVTFNQLYLAALYWNLFAVPITKEKKKETNPNTMQHLFMIVKL